MKAILKTYQLRQGQSISFEAEYVKKTSDSLKQILLISGLILFTISPALSQDTTTSQTCWRGICKVYTISNQGYYVTDSLGNVLIPLGYKSIQFTDLRNYLIVRDENGMKGIVNLDNQEIVPIKYKDVKVHSQGFIITKSIDSLISLYDTLSHVILPPDQWKIKIELLPATYIFATRDSLYYIHDHKGKRLFEFGIKGYDRSYYMGQSCFRITLQNGNLCLFGLPELQDKLSMEYQNIERPKYHKSVTILTWLPNKNGEVLKQLAIGSKLRTDPIYKEICFDPLCIEPFKDEISYDYIKPPKLFYGVGILPDMSMHIFDVMGQNTVTVPRPSPESNLIWTYLCNNYKNFQISNHLMPIRYQNILFPGGVTAKEAWMIDSIYSAGDTIYYLESKFNEFVKYNLLSQKECDEMVNSLQDLTRQSDTFNIGCASMNSNSYSGNMTITFSQPVFTNERTKCLLTYEIVSQSNTISKPIRTRKTLFLQFKGGKWVDTSLIEIDINEVSDK